MAVDTSVIGKPTGAWQGDASSGVRSSIFASRAAGRRTRSTATRRRRAARGLRRTSPRRRRSRSRCSYWGAFAEEQPPDPTGGANPMHTIMGELFAKGALVLHGEQEFEYHRPIVVGDVLDGEGRRSPTSTRRRPTARDMTFVVIETEWTDADATGAPVRHRAAST